MTTERPLKYQKPGGILVLIGVRFPKTDKTDSYYRFR